jgi:peptide-methionine (R)-S-oxide reductase
MNNSMLIAVSLICFAVACNAQEQTSTETTTKIYVSSQNEVVTVDKIKKTDEEWKAELTPEEFEILRKKGTERAFTGKYYHYDGKGVYLCRACGTELYTSDTKYDSGSGWPSFYDIIDEHNVEMVDDPSLGMLPTGLRYCVNSASLHFKPAESDDTE